MRRVAHIVFVVGRIVGAAAFVACAPKPAEPLNNPATWDPAKAPPARLPPAATRPVLELTHLIPEFHEELRWPLSSMTHPNLEPRFAIAQALAQPGVGWIDLCGLGAQNRYGRDRDLLSYLRGWCNAIKGDVDGACANLTPLIGSTHLGITDAVKIDLANILVDQGPADKAEHWINKHHINDVEILDLLAANYAEIGKNQDSFDINRRVIDSDDHASSATQCRRMVREIMLGESRLSPLIDTIHSLATKPKLSDPTCVALDHKVQCWLNKGNCTEYFREVGIDVKYAYLSSAYDQWVDVDDKSPASWWTVADTAAMALPLEGAAHLVIAATENAVRANGGCAMSTYKWIRAKVPELRRSITSGDYTERLKVLENICRYGE